MKFLLKILVLGYLVFLPEVSLGNTLICWDRNVTPTLPAFGNNREAAESWYPPYVKLSDDYVQWGEGRNDWYVKQQNEEIGGNVWRITEYVNNKGNIYQIKYNKAVNTISVLLSSSGNFIPKMPVQYMKCEITGSSVSNNTSIKQSASMKAFNNLSSCNKQYIQQFLKGQDLYSGSIDGLWGQGTINGLTQLSKKGKLKGNSLEVIIKKLSQNPMCD